MPTADRPRFTAFVVPHTHWDREWYQPFKVFQARLVDVIDAALDLLGDPAYRRFTLDGQAAVLEDYLAMRPEREEDLRRYVQAGRLRIGPWYVLADEFLVSPEALVRNLLVGGRVSRRFGDPLPVCYTPDSFGHVSQLPLIAAGFGLPAIVFERGLGDEGERLRGEFVWVAADGETGVFTAHLIGTYSGATALGHVDWELTDAYDDERAMGHLRAALYGVQGDEVADLPEWFRASLERVGGGLTAHATGSALILLNGSDHLFPQPNLPQVLRKASEAFPEIEFVQGDVEEFVTEARRTAAGLERFQGEFRGSRYQHILAGVLSARLYLKRENQACQTALEQYAEPLAALAWWASGRHPDALLREAWKLLLLNHPHDSICGCSVDAVHREMLTRFENVRQLGDDVCRRAFALLGGRRPSNIQEVHATAKDAFTVFDPLPFPRRAVVRHELDLPAGEASELTVLDVRGRALSAQVTVTPGFAPGQSSVRVDHVTIDVLADLEPLGLTNLLLARAGSATTATGTNPTAPVSPDATRAFRDAGAPSATVSATEGPDGLRLENDLVSVTIRGDGDVELRARRSGERYALKLRLEDQADAGDEYDFSPVPGDGPAYFSDPCRPPRLVTSGPVVASARLEYALELPERLSDDRAGRTGRVTLPVTLDLTLHADDPLLRVSVGFTNTASDHRLRLRLATGTPSETVWADGHFDVLERTVRPVGGLGWFQTPPPTNHQRRFVAVSGAGRGLAVLDRGLPEYEAFNGEGGTELAVTLVRSVGWLSRTDLLSRPQGAGPLLPTPEAQCLGEHRCELAVYPFSGPWWESDLLRRAQEFTAPPLTAPGASAGAGAGLLRVEGPFDLSAVKRSEERQSLIVRVANPAPVAATGRLRLGRPVSAVYATRLDETRLEELGANQDIPLQLGPRSVASFEFVPEGG
ncbi:MAG: hypothetical protein KIT12_00815 [Trueperaceae bacterium]|nr:hypothetical protein [Trueperaceae bacterium]